MHHTKLSALALAAALLAGCAGTSEDLGDVSVALTAPGADGATYRLTPGTRAAIYGGPFYDEYALDGDGVLHLEVPIGIYQAELIHDDGYSTVWPLERLESDGTLETVQATLVTMMPADLTIVAGTPTSLVFTFQVEDVGPITFTSGDLDVSIDVDELPADGTTASANGAYTVGSVFVGVDAPSGLAAQLPATGDAVNFGISVRTIGTWAQAAASGACVDVAIDSYGVGGHDGLAAMIDESTVFTGDAAAQLCVFTFEGTTQAQILFYRSGAATTPLFTAFGDVDYSFLGYVLVDLPGAIFQGDTLHLDDLVGTQVAPATMFTRVNARPAGALTARTRWYRASYDGEVTFQFGATP